VLALAAGLIGSWAISRSLARPIRQLTEAMAVVGSGRLDHPVPGGSGDEIGDLARAFSRMTDSLRQNVSQLEHTQAQLVQSEKLASIGEMSAAVAHGLRNPLASLRAAAQLVRRHPESPAAGEHLDAILEEVDRLDRRISHLLSFSRHPFHVSESLPRLIELSAGRRAPMRTSGWAEDGSAGGLPRCVDPMQLEQAILRSCRTRSTRCRPAAGSGSAPFSPTATAPPPSSWR
jgi:signal transduction histidine kinase